MRRDCQEILPGLLLGPFQASKSLETLKSLGITHMSVSPSVFQDIHDRMYLTPHSPNYTSVCIRDAKEAFSVRPRFPDHFTYLVLDVQDNEEQNLIRLFPQYALVYHFYSLPQLSARNLDVTERNNSSTARLQLEGVF